MMQVRTGALALGAALAAALVAVPAVKASETRRIEIVRTVSGRSYVGLGLEDTSGAERGARVKQVVEGTPAEKAGFKDGDVVTRFDGESVRSAAHLARLVAETPEGRAVPVEVRRDGTVQKLEVTPEAGRAFAPEPPEAPDAPSAPLPPRAPRAPRPPRMPELRDFDFRWHQGDLPALMLHGGPRKLGIEYQPIEGQLAKYFKLSGDEGILVTSVEADGPAAKAGLKAGDVLVKLGTRTIEDSRDLHRALDAAEPGSELAVQVIREGRAVDLKVTLGGQRDKKDLDGEET